MKTRIWEIHPHLSGKRLRPQDDFTSRVGHHGLTRKLQSIPVCRGRILTGVPRSLPMADFEDAMVVVEEETASKFIITRITGDFAH